MKTHAIFAGIAGALLLTTMAGSANAQVRAYPDGAECNHLDGGALVTCQNQVYSQQLESGVSHMTADPAAVPSSHIEGNDATQPDFVPGSEGTAETPIYAAPERVYSLEGPEGTRVYVPTE